VAWAHGAYRLERLRDLSRGIPAGQTSHPPPGCVPAPTGTIRRSAFDTAPSRGSVSC
jgi:hypothetical protein